MRWTSPPPWDLALALALLLILDALVALDAGGPFRVALGVVAVLVAPGHLLASALFPARHRVVEVRAGEAGEEETRRSEEGLDGLERLALAVGLSVAIVPLVGLALNFTPWGVRPAPVLAALTLLSLGLAGAAAWRRASLPPERRFHLAPRAPFPSWSDGSPLDKALVVGLAAAVVMAGGALAYALAAQRAPEPFTELYLLGAQGRAADYPETLAPGEEANVTVGVVNHEGEAVTYALRVVAERGRPVDASGNRTFEPEGETLLRAWSVTLDPGARHEEEVRFSLSAPGVHRVRFELDKPGAPESPYRRAHLFVDVTG